MYKKGSEKEKEEHIESDDLSPICIQINFQVWMRLDLGFLILTTCIRGLTTETTVRYPAFEMS